MPIALTGGAAAFDVEEVRLDQEGLVHHVGTWKSGAFVEGETVECKVDAARRLINTKLHSAGHLIDLAVTELDIPWVAGKGAHYPHMSFVEYDNGGTPHYEADVQAITDKLAELSRSTYENKILFVPVVEMGKYCKHVPDNIPTNKPSRIVLYADDFGIPCGGTHVKKVSDIGRIVITKVKSKGGVTKVSYAVSGINW